MKPTAEQIEKLARVFCEGQTGYQDDWAGYCLDESNVVCTRETLDDYRKNSLGWRESNKPEEIQGGLFFEGVQAQKGQPRVDFAIIDCGEFRLSYKQ